MPKPISVLLSIAVTLSILQAGCSRTAEDYVSKGDKFLEARKYDDADLLYRKAIQKDPTLGEAWYGIGLVEMGRDRGAAAYDPLLRAVELMPQNTPAKVRLADVSLALLVVDPRHPRALYEQVEKLADQLLAKDENSFDGLRLKGSLLLFDRNAKAAATYFERANRIEPMRPDLVEGWVQALFQDNRAAEGERLALDVIAANKNFGSMYGILYRQYMSMSRTLDGENLLKLRAANNPADPDALFQLARHYAGVHNPVEMNHMVHRIRRETKNRSDAQLRMGDFYASIGEWEQAFREFEEGAQSNASQKLIFQKRMTDTLLACGKKAEARKIVELILKDQPNEEDARRIRSSLLLDEGGADNNATALADLKALAAVRGNDARVRFLAGRAYVATGDLNAGRNEFLQVVNLRKDDDLPARLALSAISLNQGKPDEAIQYANEVLVLDSANRAAKLLRVTAMIAAGYYGRARTELKSLIHEYPQSGQIQFQFGLLAIAEKKYSEAEKVFRKLDQQRTGDAGTVAALVATWSVQNQWDSAIQLLNQHLKASPDSAAIRRLLAATAARAGKYDLAISEYQRLLASNPKSIDLRMQLGGVYRLKGDLNSAIAVLQPTREWMARDPEPLMLLGSMLQEAGRNSEAQADFRRALQFRPDNPFILNNLAFLLTETGSDLDEALRLSQRALQKSPGHPVLTDTLGWIYLKKGDKGSAIRTFSSLVRQQPENAMYRYHYAVALLESGDTVAAKSEVRSALTSRPVPGIENKIKALADRIG
jgi:tetratricopeptide (TPR) repeat protein